MYGIPLTVYFAANTFTGESVNNPDIVYKFDFFGQNISLTIAMVYGTVLMVIGTIFVVLGWITLYRNLKTNETLVTVGIYSYSRHPQYFGFVLVIFGWLVGWPTILTLIFAPILIYVYVRVCKVEEKELSENSEYSNYKKRVPFFI
jgi:protein-S-isoprenylcysteine O-methyltransferase Ste14